MSSTQGGDQSIAVNDMRETPQAPLIVTETKQIKCNKSNKSRRQGKTYNLNPHAGCESLLLFILLHALRKKYHEFLRHGCTSKTVYYYNNNNKLSPERLG